MKKVGHSVAVILLSVLFVLVSQMVVAPLSLSVTAATSPTVTKVGVQPSRQQFGLVSSGSIAVWEDRKIPDLAKLKATPYGRPDDRGTSDILGYNFATNQPLIVTNAAGDQMNPAISGAIVAWEDNRQSCPTCQRDIRAKDLSTGIEYIVASGPADNVFPVVAGRTIVWVASGFRVMSKELGSSTAQVIATAPAGAMIDQPVVSPDVIAWTERIVQGNAVRSVIRAYNRKTRTVRTIDQTNWPGLGLAVSGQHLVYVSPSLNLFDLATNTNTVLDSDAVTTPNIVGDTVLWGSYRPGVEAGLEMRQYSLSIHATRYHSLGITPSSRPTIAGNFLLWQSDAALYPQIEALPLTQAFADSPAPTPIATSAPINQPSSPVSTRKLPDGQLVSYTNPLYKGVHTANGNFGWNNGGGKPCNQNGCPAIDGLGAPFYPLFGSYVVLSSDLSRPTGRTNFQNQIWGPTVAAAMQWVQRRTVTSDGKPTRVVIRTFAPYPYNGIVYPKPDGSVTPDVVAQEVVALAQNYSWVRDVQLDNEPNLEWPCSNPGDNGSCSGSWTSGNQNRGPYTWTGINDANKYKAINDFYSDAWWSIQAYKSSLPALNNMNIWTTPISDVFNSSITYANLQGMISLYGLMTYHTYPAPNYDAINGGVKNNSWYGDFTSWLQTQINAGSVRTMITEFGWNPGQMSACGISLQDTNWTPQTYCGAGNPTGTADGQTHTFDHDLLYFLANERHKAEVVAAWIERGGSGSPAPDQDGIDQFGHVRGWFSRYQFSTP